MPEELELEEESEESDEEEEEDDFEPQKPHPPLPEPPTKQAAAQAATQNGRLTPDFVTLSGKLQRARQTTVRLFVFLSTRY